MPATQVNFFNPTDVLGSSFTIQSRSPSKTSNRAQGLGADGDEIASKTYGATTSDSITYKCFTASGSFSLSSVAPGTVSSGWHIDQISVKYTPTDWPEISVTAHKHDDCETGITSHGTAHRKMAPSVTLPMGFGCPTGLMTLVGLSAETKIGLSGFTYTASVTHQDEVGGSGAYLASDNRDGSETIEVSTVGVPSSAPSIEDWDVVSSGTPTSNSSAETATYSLEHHTETEAPSA